MGQSGSFGKWVKTLCLHSVEARPHFIFGALRRLFEIPFAPDFSVLGGTSGQGKSDRSLFLDSFASFLTLPEEQSFESVVVMSLLAPLCRVPEVTTGFGFSPLELLSPKVVVEGPSVISTETMPGSPFSLTVVGALAAAMDWDIDSH